MKTHTIVLNITTIFSLIILLHSCGSGNSEPDLDNWESEQSSSETLEEVNNENNLVSESSSKNESKAFDEYTPENNLDHSTYQDGDLHINELNLEIKKLQAELNHYKANLRELSAKSQVWGNPFTVYNKEIILSNGTTVFGKIIYQDRDVVKIETLIGKLIINRSDIVRVVENIINEDANEETWMSLSPDQIEIVEVKNDDDESGINIIERRKENITAQLVLIGDIQEIKDKTGNTILSGEIKNIGTQRSDFAKINVTFRKNWHGEVETLTAFARGSYYTFKTGVTSDSSILPGAVAEFELLVPKSMGSFIGYSYTIDWEQYE